MIPADREDEARIENHRKDREGWGFITVEQPRDIERARHQMSGHATVLLDSLTALLANEMFCPDYRENALEKVNEGLVNLSESVENIVVVSDTIYSDAAHYDAMTENYRKSLALAERALAVRFDCVAEVSCAGVCYHKGDKIEIC